MPRIEWDARGEKKFETGVEQGVLYPLGNAGYEKGVAWNGLTAVTESPEGAELNDLYADDIKYASLRSAETFKATIEAYTYPDQFAECDGTAEPVTGVRIGQQPRKAFGFCYKTIMGNDISDHDGYKLHIIYNCTCSPSEKAYQTINDSPDAITFSWEMDSTPVNVTGHKATSCIVIDSTKFTETSAKARLTALENKLYGTDPDTEAGTAGTDPELPDPDEVISTLTAPTVGT